MEENLQSEDKAVIDSKMQTLSEASQKFGEMMYAKAAAEAQKSQQDDSATKGDAKVVDAEFSEVKDDSESAAQGDQSNASKNGKSQEKK